jgi:hypothetical protein
MLDLHNLGTGALLFGACPRLRPKAEVLGSKFLKPRTSDLEPSSISLVPRPSFHVLRLPPGLSDMSIKKSPHQTQHAVRKARTHVLRQPNFDVFKRRGDGHCGSMHVVSVEFAADLASHA